MTDRELMQQALEALETLAKLTGARWALENSYAGHLEAITALRERLAKPEGAIIPHLPGICCKTGTCDREQPVQEYPLPDDLYESKDWKAGTYAERVEWLHSMYEAKKRELEDYLAQPENGGKTGWPPGLLQDDDRKLSKWFASKPDARQRVREAVAQPQPRRWVGLTEEEMVDLQDRCGISIHQSDFEAIEAKLREKNT